MRLSPDDTDWSSRSQQESWFSRFATDHSGSVGISLEQFKLLLKEIVYPHVNKQPLLSRFTDHVKLEDDLQYLTFSEEDELRLFKIFDTKCDQQLDQDEFAYLCSNWLVKIFKPPSALVVVDVQNDFINGTLALINGPAQQDGAEVVPVINKLLEVCHFDLVVYTQDWHPRDHVGFYENLHLRKYKTKKKQQEPIENDHDCSANDCNQPAQKERIYKLEKVAAARGIKPFDTVLFDDGLMEQILWPMHCVQESWGAQLHPELRLVPDAVHIRKGTLSNVDAYSAFWDNMRLNETELRQELVSRNISDVYFCGLAFDYCVGASALDSARAGFATFVIEDACRGIDLDAMEQRRSDMLAEGIQIVRSDSIIMSAKGDTKGLNCSIGYAGLGHDGHHEETCCTKSRLLPSEIFFDRRALLDVCLRKALSLDR